MPARTNYSKGLTVPVHIKKLLTEEMLAKLEQNGCGISFNSAKSVQMRYVVDGEDLGSNYPMSKYGNSWELAITEAIADNTALAIKHQNSAKYASPKKGVNFRRVVKKGVGKTYVSFAWIVSFNDNGKNKLKSFGCGGENTMTIRSKKHAELTAWYFRRLYCESGDPSVLSAKSTKNWPSKKYYLK
jgi:hypothetical protein